MLRYQYAWRGKRRVDVLTLDSNGGGYSCMGCGQPMRANTQGQVRGKYFSHVPGYAENRDCAETYLHIVAKNIFYWVFRERRREGERFVFDVWLRYRCGAGNPDCDRGYRASLELIALFDRIEVEKRAGAFIPDLRLFSSTGDQQLYVEILVSSPCSQATDVLVKV